MARKPKSPAIPIDSLKYRDTRTNIPTEELRDFVAADENKPQPVLYPRDSSLDPQLVWKGKDEQDQHPLAVPDVPIYIQEKIHPRAIIEDFRSAISNSKSQISDSKSQISNSKSQISNSKSQISDPKSGISNPKSQISNLKSQISNLKSQISNLKSPLPSPGLFDDFNGLPADFAERIDFYHHHGHWSNRMILGDSLLVMTSLAEKESLKGKVQTIYLDPPYGIKFGSNWQVSTRKRDVKDGRAEDATRQPEQVRAFRDTWKLGIHSYLSYLRDRLSVARELLSESGSIFVQIGEDNVHLVRSVLDEVFGSENSIATVTFKKTTTATSGFLAITSDYLLWYGKAIDRMKYRPIFKKREVGGDGAETYLQIESPDGSRRRLSSEELRRPALIPKDARPYTFQLCQSQRQGRPSGPGSAMYFPVKFGKRTFYPNGNRGWSTTREGMEGLLRAKRLDVQGDSLSYIRYFDDFPVTPLNNIWADTQSGSAMEKVYVVQTNLKVIERCLLMTTDPGDLVLDPTCGSGTTAVVAEQWGRRWIMIDTSRVALALARTRLMGAKYPYYLLADSAAGRRKEFEISDLKSQSEISNLKSRISDSETQISDLKSQPSDSETQISDLKSQSEISNLKSRISDSQSQISDLKSPSEISNLKSQSQISNLKSQISNLKSPISDPDIRRGFVYQRVPHVTLKSIANNPDIHEGMSREAIDKAILKHAETETLYDKPYEDKKRLRVTGPFTVESLSPHRTIQVEDKKQAADKPGADGFTIKMLAGGSFSNTILDYLRKTPIQTGKKAERLKLDSVEIYAGQWINGEGRYTESSEGGDKGSEGGGQSSGGGDKSSEAGDKSSGKEKRVAICIGPEYGTVGPELVKEAAKEAVKGVGFDLLLVCGFAFDPHVSEEAKRYGKLKVLPVRMNPDLSMGDELLKKTGAGNLFMVFGEPDVMVEKTADGKIVVEIRGLDVYDPTTGEVRSSSTDDIACWFIDTDYNGESFFVRHAYFTGADEPYEKLKRALRAEIDPAAWSSLYATTSRAFDPPASGKIAVKVINHYGDEVLKVYEMPGGAKAVQAQLTHNQ